MADNQSMYGFRLFRGDFSGSVSPPNVAPVAVISNYDSTTPVGTAGVGFHPGDVVTIDTNGTAIHVTAPGNADVTTVQAQRPYGVVVGIGPVFNANKGQFGLMDRFNFLPAGITYGTNLERQSVLLIVPIAGNTFEVDVKGSAVATTQAAFQLLIGTNVNLIYTASTTFANPTLDSASANYVTTPRQFRITGISPNVANQDFSGANVKLLVVGNTIENAPFNTTGV